MKFSLIRFPSAEIITAKEHPRKNSPCNFSRAQNPSGWKRNFFSFHFHPQNEGHTNLSRFYFFRFHQKKRFEFSISFLLFFPHFFFIHLKPKSVWCGGEQNTLLINKRPTPSPGGVTRLGGLLKYIGKKRRFLQRFCCCWFAILTIYAIKRTSISLLGDWV